MAFLRGKAFEVTDDGLLIGDVSHLVAGSLAPTTAMPSPTGATLYLQSDGSVWTWNGSAWVQFLPGRNFSYRKLIAGQFLSIPFEQQMVVSQEIEIEDTAELEVLGEMAVIP